MMSKRNQYPDECPVFRYAWDGKDYELSPGLNKLTGDLEPFWFVTQDGCMISAYSDLLEPLTLAADQLIAWVRQ